MSYSNATLQPFSDRIPASQNHVVANGDINIFGAPINSRVLGLVGPLISPELHLAALVHKPFRLPQPGSWAGATPELSEGFCRRGCHKQGRPGPQPRGLSDDASTIKSCTAQSVIDRSKLSRQLYYDYNSYLLLTSTIPRPAQIISSLQVKPFAAYSLSSLLRRTHSQSTEFTSRVRVPYSLSRKHSAVTSPLGILLFFSTHVSLFFQLLFFIGHVERR